MIGMIPKYYLVKQKIVEMINNEEIGPDGMIPSERELMGSFGISRITAKKAIDDLVNEGYLYRIQGKGTFVKKDTLDQDLISITSCTQDIVKLGMTPSKRLLTAEVLEADKARAKKLQLSNGEKVLKVKRVYYANNEPINLTTTYLPCKTFPLIETYDFGVHSIYDVLESKYNTRITKATRTIEAVLAVDEVAKELEIKEGDPILLFRAVTFGMVNGREVPIETFKSFYRSDKFKFYINQIHQ
ncbi:GntR family transcriptional regulator [Ruminiclostridium cellobioparum]|jgi:GntR family transcriptional regulator|uniref:Transcriptional regulator n=1 Tax=Ruminiclostridium cellobioparum subsp. termitidis CT1112 TaxID=1195236 RepID=S0FTI3_RUMCE|nr:GntR family transcriptional regulator [Ruminiclostridium cellobioparum]EMS72479.1 transcriptional regulator [Ruminiclostridium cellobioparum subsp. termitidis CT1112]